MKKIFLLIFVFALIFPLNLRAAVLKSTYPRLANYFLKWEISDAEALELAKWDLLILDMEAQENSRKQLLKIRELNPKIIILAYLSVQEVLIDVDDYRSADLRQELNCQFTDSWYLKDRNGNRISNWPGAQIINVTDGAGKNNSGKRFNDYLPEFVSNKIQSSGLWDGVFYDNVGGEISWLNNGNFDLNNDGKTETAAEADYLWSSGFTKILEKTRQLVGHEFIVVGNGKTYAPFQNKLNGMMFESFPAFWENGGTWTGSMQNYLKYQNLNLLPQTAIINVGDKNQENYRHLRFGLGSALLGDGFFSFDYDVTNHAQTWWYDEYNINLGPAQTKAYNLLDNNSEVLKPGLWRRDFKYGSVILNSSDKERTQIFLKEDLEKISGTQDLAFNTGAKINYLKLAAQDGIILLKKMVRIESSPFTNGYFYRVYNFSGSQVRNGFFAYLSGFPGEAEIISASENKDNPEEIGLSAAAGKIILYKNSKQVSSFFPYDKAFKKKVNLSAKITDGYFRQIVSGAGAGGGPQVRIFSPLGKLIGSFFAYDKNSRGGVYVALGDIDNDGEDEIVTGPGVGQEPTIKIFSLKGILKNSFLAYDKNFKGGVGIALGDVNGDDKLEIISAPISGGGPHVRIFSAQGDVLGNFFAYDKSYHGGVKVSASDINNDGQDEILVGIKEFY